MRVITAAPTVSLTAYAAGDAVGGLLEFAFGSKYPGDGGIVVGAAIVDKSGQAAPLSLQLFDRTFTASADNAAYAPSDADIENALGNIEFAGADYAGGSGNSVATKRGLELAFVPSGTSLFGQLFTGAGGTPTYTAADDLIVKLFVEGR